MKIKILVKNYSKYVLLITVFVLTSNLSSQTAGEIKDTVEQEISAVALPFGLYSEILGWAAGGFVGIQGLSQRNMSIYMGGLLSTNGTKYGFLQFREFYGFGFIIDSQYSIGLYGYGSSV